MPQRFTAYVERGRPDNLKESINVAFTMTPVKSGGGTPEYTPYARWVTPFPVNVGRSVSFEWSWELAFATYEEGLSRLGHQQRRYTRTMVSPLLVPGQYVAMTGSPRWSGAAPYFDPEVMKMKNLSGSAQKILLCGSHQLGMVAYQPIENYWSIIVPAGLEIQAYVVGDGIAGQRCSIQPVNSKLTADASGKEMDTLLPEDLNRPIFAEAINCNDLPSVSTWRLCRGRDGKIQLINDDKGGERPSPPSQLVAEPVTKLKDQLDTISKSLGDTQRRLEVGERTTARLQDDLSKVLATTLSRAPSGLRDALVVIQESLVSLRDQFKDSERRLTLVEAKMDKLDPSSVRSALQVLVRKVPGVELKAQTLESSIHQNQDDIFAVQGSVGNLGGRLADLNRKVIAFGVKTERLEELLKGREEFGIDDGILPSFDDSPVTFPSGI